MKLVGVKEFYNITRAKVISALNCAIVITVCATATFAVDTALDSTSVQAKPMETFAQAQEVTVTVVYMPGESDMTTEPTEATTTTTETTAATSTTTTSESTTDTEATTESTTEATTEATTAATTAETTQGYTEEELYLVVYATTTINVRSGPGTEYDVVKSVYAGDQIDVCAVTSNGWYKTYNGNYVLASLTTETEPTATPKPTPKPTSSSTSSTTAATEAPKPAPAGEGNSCTITFYGPQLMSDGSYSKSTATGTTCTEGRTCAADWSIYPAGTVIYIENDPLGGDGYYTVEDRGPGVKGYHIDIYAEDGESGSHTTCYRTVYAQ